MNTNIKKVKTGGLVYPQMDDKGYRHQGITLREHYAGLAMQTLLQAEAKHSGYSECTSAMPAISKSAFAMADSMIVAKGA